ADQKVNKDELKNALDDAKSKNPDDYTKDTWDKLKDAYDEANKVYGDKDATQKEVDDATKKLNDALGKLEKKPSTEKPSKPSDITVKPNDKGGFDVDGKGEPGTNVEITDKNGNVIGTGTVDKDGNIHVEIPKDKVKPGDKIDVTVTDDKGNKSDKTEVTVPNKDTEKPSKPSDITVKPNDKGGFDVDGKGEPGTKVEITDKDGNVIGTGTVDKDGNIHVEIPKDKVKPGDKIDVTITDDKGNKSDKTEVTVPNKDTEKPSKPSDITVKPNDKGGFDVDGKGEPGTNVEITDKDGNVIGTGTVDKDGNIHVEIPKDKVKPGDKIDVTVTDDKDNKSDKTEVTVPNKDTEKPSKPSDVTVDTNKDGDYVIGGKTDPNTKVEITDKDGNVIGTGTSDDKGNFEITVPKDKVKPGDKLDVTVTDKNGNKSDGTQITVPNKNTEKPSKPSDVTVKPNDKGGFNVDGKGEPGTKVEITDKDGNVIGTGTVDKDGKFHIEIPKDKVKPGDKLDITVTDKNGNKSDKTEVTVPKDKDKDKDLDKKKNDGKNIIDNLPNLTPSEKEDYKKKINGATSIDAINKIVKDAQKLSDSRYKKGGSSNNGGSNSNKSGNNKKSLPSTGEVAGSAGLVGIALASIAGFLGLARKKREDEE
ncbi:Ig-like domain-containing protein, partial [Floricoccus penangensis]|uniref:Ig-like domain-containing protein n=1 Tax=Floricoccus penangensis TaxID=1859475 RepID=UPI000AE21FED